MKCGTENGIAENRIYNRVGAIKIFYIMFTILKRAVFAIAIMAMATVSFANDDNDNGNTEPGQGTPALPTITVTVLEKGANCPDHGTVKHAWYWPHSLYPTQEAIKSGTPASYSNPPCTVVLQSVYPGPPWDNKPTKVNVTVEPTGHPEAANSLMVNYPFPMIGISPGSCNGGGQPYNYFKEK